MTVPSTDKTIRISNVCKSYGDYEVLKNVDAEVARGEVVVICGPQVPVNPR